MDLNKIIYKTLAFCSIISISLFILGLSILMLYPASLEEEIYSNFPLTMMWQNPPLIFLFTGILILIVAPITATAISMIVYALKREYKFAFLPFIVLLVIISSLILGITGIICPKA